MLDHHHYDPVKFDCFPFYGGDQDGRVSQEGGESHDNVVQSPEIPLVSTPYPLSIVVVNFVVKCCVVVLHSFSLSDLISTCLGENCCFCYMRSVRDAIIVYIAQFKTDNSFVSCSSMWNVYSSV